MPLQSPSPAQVTATGHSEELTGDLPLAGRGPGHSEPAAHLTDGISCLPETRGYLLYPTALNPPSPVYLTSLLGWLPSPSDFMKTPDKMELQASRLLFVPQGSPSH